VTCAAGYHPLVGNGFCNDETNIVECDYDGGDCCPNPELVANSVCNNENDIAECDYDGGDCCPNPNLVGDAICHDETNHLGCNYDGGDCCGNNIISDHCTECVCYGKEIFINIYYYVLL
jgi:hypothetical protein